MPSAALAVLALSLAAAAEGVAPPPAAAPGPAPVSPTAPASAPRPPPLSGEEGQGEGAAPAGPLASRRYVVEQIRFEGLTRTRPSEVRRHLSIAEGELLDDQAVLLSRLRLLQLGWFSRVETRVERGRERGLVTLVFDFTERNTLMITDFVLGSTGPQPLYGGLGVSQGNFLGLGLALGGAFVYGGTPADQPLAPARFALRGSFFDPDLDLGGLPLVFGVSALALHGEELACGDPECSAYQGRYGSAPRLRYDRLGGELTFGLRPGPFERLLAGYRVERVGSSRLSGAGGDPISLAPYTAAALAHPGRSWVSALTATYDRDTRNDLFFPTDGSRLAVNIVLGTEALGGDYEYSRYLIQLESDHALPRGHGLRLLAAAGAVQGDAPFFDRFYAADFAYFSIGPALGRALELNFSTDARYDAYLALAGAEYGVPLWGDGAFFHRGYLALGGRWVYTAARARAGRTRASSTPFSGDVALRLDTPVGSFNVSLGYALDNFL
ncbi:BamA/TamA family outer membrane protein [Anaeromyxobacter diazotrophicus]|uniref:BamA/TamA family outer membrane protein n=1 Tax=Anaeromyxobacter diazotrophicus TaxID=2590199 RepID=UPI001591F672|nr:BamA/TamA family outer membrane protein [Anaeromyxobacter diazotrophicus]